MKANFQPGFKVRSAIHRELGAYLTLVFVGILFGGNTIAMKVISPQMPPLTIALFRGLFGLCILLPFAWRQLVHGQRPSRREIGFFAFLGLLGIALPYTTLALGLKYTSAANASIIFATGAALTIIILAVGWHAVPSRTQILAVITSFAGLIFVFSKGSLHNLVSLQFNPSDFILLINVVSVSFFCILGQEVMKKFSPLVTTVYSLIFGVLMLIPLAGWESSVTQWQLPWSSWLIVAYMGFVVTGIALMLNLSSIRQVGSAQAAIFSNLSPVFGILLGVLLLNEHLYSYHWLGIFLVFTGVFLSVVREPSSCKQAD